MRWLTIALFLLSSISLPGCNKPIGAADETVSADDDPLASLRASDSDPIETPSPESGAVESSDGPMLSAVSFEGELQGLKSAPKRRVFLLYYSYSKKNGAAYDCPACMIAKPKLKAWANEQNFTTAEENEGHARSATVRFVDINRDKVTQDLTLEGESSALYPTYLWVDQTGKVLWSDCGVKDGPQLTRTWKLLERMR